MLIAGCIHISFDLSIFMTSAVYFALLRLPPAVCDHSTIFSMHVLFGFPLFSHAADYSALLLCRFPCGSFALRQIGRTTLS